MKKILFIIGSLRKESFNKKLTTNLGRNLDSFASCRVATHTRLSFNN